MYWCLFFALILAFGLGYWYRDWVHTIEINDGEGDYLGG